MNILTYMNNPESNRKSAKVFDPIAHSIRFQNTLQRFCPNPDWKPPKEYIPADPNSDEYLQYVIDGS